MRIPRPASPSAETVAASHSMPPQAATVNSLHMSFEKLSARESNAGLGPLSRASYARGATRNPDLSSLPNWRGDGFTIPAPSYADRVSLIATVVFASIPLAAVLIFFLVFG